jgi:hypothetical protein
MGLLNLGNLKKSKVKVSKTNLEQSHANKSLAQSKEKFGLKTGKGINLPKGNPPINK